MRILKESDEITQDELQQLERYVNKLFDALDIDVRFSYHFRERMNDPRNGTPITLSELVRLFKQTYKKWGKKIASFPPDTQAVLRDMKTNINMPFVIDINPRNQELELKAKTIMRKQRFRTSNEVLAVEDANGNMNDPILLVDGFGKLAKSQIERKIKEYANSINDLANTANDSMSFGNLEYYVNNGVLAAMVKTLKEYHTAQENSISEQTKIKKDSKSVMEAYKKFKSK